MALTCPNCHTATSFSPALITDRRAVDVERSRGQATVFIYASLNAVVQYGVHSFAVLVCQACDEPFLGYKLSSWDDWIAAWPMPDVTVVDSIPEPIRSAVVEAKTSFAVEAYGACLLMARTSLTRMQREQKVGSFKELAQSGHLSGALYGQADEVRLWANVVGHEDFDPAQVGRLECEELLTYLDAVMDAIYVQPARLAKVREQRQNLSG